MIQGMAEEVMCRGFLLTSISRCHSVTTAVLVSSAVFSLLHILNPSGFLHLPLINIFLYGIFASMLFLRTESIWFCAGFHTAWNFTQGTILGIPASGLKLPSIFTAVINDNLSVINGGDFGLEGGLGVTVILVFGCLILFLIGKTRNKAELSMI